MPNDSGTSISTDHANEELVKAVQELPPDLRMVYVARYVQRKPLAEAATALRISKPDAAALETKAIGVLRLRMAEHLDIGSRAEVRHYRETLKKVGMDPSYIDMVIGSDLAKGQDQ